MKRVRTKMPKRIQPRQIFVYTACSAVAFFFFVFFLTSLSIGHSVGSTCRDAQTRHSGDCVTALIAVLQDGSNSFRDRNHAIWALGQLGDSRALPALLAYYTGTIPDKEPLDAGLSQYELQKAIQLTGGGVNISAFVWRHF